MRPNFYGIDRSLMPQQIFAFAMAELRQSAEGAFANLAQQALIRYAKDHDGRFSNRSCPVQGLSADIRRRQERGLIRFYSATRLSLRKKFSHECSRSGLGHCAKGIGGRRA